jgi:pyridoxal phosphate enzyme, YggS family
MLFYLVAKGTMIAENLKAVRQRISMSCERSGRPVDAVKLVCVTKEASIPEIEEVLALGVKDIGENRVQDALVKYKAIGGGLAWHMIGHLQTNKVRDAVGISSLIHSVDSLRLAEAIDREAKRAGKIQDVLIQVNVSGEESKFGISRDEVRPFFEKAASYNNVNIAGLMTIAPEAGDPEDARPHFRALRELRDQLNEIQDTRYKIQILSMGMTNDFEVAIEEGSTMVRIGRAIFK